MYEQEPTVQAHCFAAAYALILLAVAAAREHLGDSGLYTVAALSGLTDMDAITLSSARRVAIGSLDAATGWRTIVVAAMANFTFKFGMVAVLGHRSLTLRVGVAFALAVGCGVLILRLWPG